MKKQVAVACLLTLACLACAQPSAAQKSDDRNKPESFAPGGAESLPPELKDAFKPVELPEGKDAWALQLITRGGLTGRGRGDVTVTSDNRVRCSPDGADCLVKQRGTDPASLFASLSQRVAAARPSKWKASAGAACNDCYLTLFVLQTRAGNGQSKTYTFYWDDSTAAAVPADVRGIVRAVSRLTFVPTRVL
jgi:hypothetical protein